MATNKKAFTLIELLVVIAIIAMLLAILVPGLKRAKNQAAAVACLANMKSFAACWHTYAMDNKEVMINGHIPRTVNAASRHWAEAPHIQNGSTYTYTGDKPINGTKLPVEEELAGIRKGLLFPYIDTTDAYHCPADKSNQVFAHTKTAGLGSWWNSYSINGMMNGERSKENNAYYSTSYDPKTATKVSDITSPGSKMVFLENSDWRGWVMGSWLMDYKTPKWTDPFAIWHGNRSPLGFADGHAEMHQWADKSTFTNSNEGYVVEDDPLPGEKGDDIRYMQQSYVPGRR